MVIASCEEFLFRYCLYRILRNNFSKPQTLLICSLLFGILLHLNYDIIDNLFGVRSVLYTRTCGYAFWIALFYCSSLAYQLTSCIISIRRRYDFNIVTLFVLYSIYTIFIILFTKFISYDTCFNFVLIPDYYSCLRTIIVRIKRI